MVWVGGVDSVLGVVGEVFVARVLVGGKVTVPLLVRDVLKIEEGDYVRVTITEVIKGFVQIILAGGSTSSTQAQSSTHKRAQFTP